MKYVAEKKLLIVSFGIEIYVLELQFKSFLTRLHFSVNPGLVLLPFENG